MFFLPRSREKERDPSGNEGRAGNIVKKFEPIIPLIHEKFGVCRLTIDTRRITFCSRTRTPLPLFRGESGIQGNENYSPNSKQSREILSRCNPVHAASDFWERDHLSSVFRRIPATLGIPTGNPPFWRTRKGKGKFRDEFLKKVLRREFDSKWGYTR